MEPPYYPCSHFTRRECEAGPEAESVYDYYSTRFDRDESMWIWLFPPRPSFYFDIANCVVYYLFAHAEGTQHAGDHAGAREGENFNEAESRTNETVMQASNRCV
jgi:hypothetical protein